MGYQPRPTDKSESQNGFKLFFEFLAVLAVCSLPLILVSAILIGLGTLFGMMFVNIRDTYRSYQQVEQIRDLTHDAIKGYPK